MNDKPRPELCKGCYVATPNETATICKLEPSWNKKQCPCTTCLVKAICTAEDEQCMMYVDFAKWQYD